MANPTDQKIAGQVATLFKGETLRGLLLNAYGWWTIGTYCPVRGDRSGGGSVRSRGGPGL